MGLFTWIKRLFNIGAAEVNSAIDKLEDPVKLTEQGIKDLKKDLNQSLQSLAEVKAMAIRSKKELEANTKAASDYEAKAILLLQKAQSGELAVNEADRLASQALAKKEQIAQRIVANNKDVAHFDQMVGKMEVNVNQLKNQISQWETELKTLKARSKVSEASAKLNKQLARVDSSDTIALLEKMRDKVQEQEALAESYQDINSQATSIDDEINQALGTGGGGANAQLGSSDALDKLKAQLEAKNAPKQVEGEASTEGNTEIPKEERIEPLTELEKLKRKLGSG